MRQNKSLKAEPKPKVVKGPSYSIDISAVEKSVARNSVTSANSFFAEDKTAHGGPQNYWINIKKEEVKPHIEKLRTKPRKKWRRIYIREILNTKTNKTRLDVSASNWASEETNKKETTKQVDAATWTEPDRSLNQLDNSFGNFCNLLDLGTNVPNDGLCPSTQLSNKVPATSDSVFQPDILDLLPMVSPADLIAPVAVHPPFEPLADGDFANLSNFDESLFSLPDLGP